MVSAHAMRAIGESVPFGDLEFTITDDGELRPAFAITHVQVIRFGSLDFISDRLGSFRLSDEGFSGPRHEPRLEDTPA
jgi:hypothetical protein